MLAYINQLAGAVASYNGIPPLAGWAGYKTITVANTGAAVTGYQQVLQLFSVDVSFALWQSAGQDIRITKADGVTVIPHWIRTWDSTNGLGEIWFKCDLGASGNTTFLLQYGNAGASSTSSYDNVMQKLGTDGGAASCLYHFDEGSGTPVDATGNTTATLFGSPTWVGSDFGGWGPFSSQNFSTGNALDLTGSNQCIQISNALNTIGSAWSLEFLVKWPSSIPTGDPRLLYKSQSVGGTYNGIDLYIETASGEMRFRTISGFTVVNIVKSTIGGDGVFPGFVAGKTYRIVIQQSNTLGKELWINGTLDGKDASATAMPSSGSQAPLTIGAYCDTPGSISNYGVFQIDELRVLPRWQTRAEIVANYTRRKWFSDVSIQADRITRSGTNPILAAGSAGAWDEDMAQEANPFVESGTWYTWYSGLKAGVSPQGLATASSATGTWTKDAANPVLGGGGSGISGSICHPGFYKEGSTYHLFASDSTGSTANLKRYTSTDKKTWTLGGTAISHTQESVFQGYANPKIIKVGSTYHMMCEGQSVSGYGWVVGHFTNSAIDNDGGWVLSPAGTLTSSLDIFQIGSYSHCDVTPIGNKYHAWFHTSAAGKDVPSVICHAVSADLKNWLPDYFGLTVIDNAQDGLTVGGYKADQVADPRMVEDTTGGTVNLFYDVSANTPSTKAKICVATYTGTLSQFVQDNPRVSSIT